MLKTRLNTRVHQLARHMTKQVKDTGRINRVIHPVVDKGILYGRGKSGCEMRNFTKAAYSIRRAIEY
jgi:hypothetical protein